jgi:hypothetical protein
VCQVLAKPIHFTFIRKATIAVSWSEAKAFINDELLLLKVLKASGSQDGHAGETVANAINAVLETTGDWGWGLHSYGNRVAQLPIEAARRILRRSRLDPDPLKLDPVSFVCRDGNLNLTFEACLRLAHAFAKAESDTVLTYVDAEERDYMDNRMVKQRRYSHMLITDLGEHPSWIPTLARWHFEYWGSLTGSASGGVP